LKIIIHAGMNKTGSSSIQVTFSKAAIAPVEYMPDSVPNHSFTMMLLFKDKVEEYHSFRARGQTRSQLLDERRITMDRLTRYFAETPAETVLISGEDISVMNGEETARLAEFVYRQTDDVQVIAYVRPPCSFISSAFQQRVKGGNVTEFRPLNLWPQYEQRFSTLDDAFGRENVVLRPFIRDEMAGGNVVLDLASFLNVDINSEDIVLANESLSLEATALLYTQRHLGKGMLTGFNRAHKVNNSFIRILAQIRGRKMVFSRSLVEGIVEVHKKDLAWIEDRLGREILDLPDPDAPGISCEADLLDLAAEQQDVLDRMLAEQFNTGSGSSQEQIAHKLDLLMSSCI